MVQDDTVNTVTWQKCCLFLVLITSFFQKWSKIAKLADLHTQSVFSFSSFWKVWVFYVLEKKVFSMFLCCWNSLMLSSPYYLLNKKEKNNIVIFDFVQTHSLCVSGYCSVWHIALQYFDVILQLKWRYEIEDLCLCKRLLLWLY